MAATLPQVPSWLNGSLCRSALEECSAHHLEGTLVDLNLVIAAAQLVSLPVLAAIIGAIISVVRPPGPRFVAGVQHFAAGVVMAALVGEGPRGQGVDAAQRQLLPRLHLDLRPGVDRVAPG
ncbi:MAG TPA: hypothetical protein PKX10_09315 [Propioniciclava tarda]|nr:hypothetical protein [Propioniciclava tarda]